MAILITGHRGFIGSRLFPKVKAFGIDLKTGYNLLSCNLPKHIDTVYHLAAQSHVESSWHDPVHDMDNIRMTARIVKEYPDAKIVYTNSAAAIDIQSPYGFSKWASAKYIKKFHKNYVIVTLPNVYGGGKSVVDFFKKNNRVTIYGDGKQTRDYVHVDDIIEGLIKAPHWPVGEYQMGSSISTSVLDLAKGKTIEWSPARKEIRNSVLRNDTPDWSPKINVLEYVQTKN